MVVCASKSGCPGGENMQAEAKSHGYDSPPAGAASDTERKKPGGTYLALVLYERGDEVGQTLIVV
eukprot:1159658-Pelagomonas_calceolata.AAC.7